MSHGPQPGSPQMGTVRVNVRRAANIKNVDLIGKSDPFVQIMMGPVEKHRTTTKKGTLTPEWNEEKTLRVPLRQSTHHGHLFPRDVIVVEMYDAQTLGKPRPLGKGVIQLRDYHYNESRHEILPMDGGGELHITVSAVDWGIGGPTPGFPEGQQGSHRRHKHRHSSPPPRPPGYGAGHLSPQRHQPLGSPQYAYLGPHTALGQMPPPPSPSHLGNQQPPSQVYPSSNIFPTIPLGGHGSPPPHAQPPMSPMQGPPQQYLQTSNQYPYPTVPVPAVTPTPQPQHPYIPPQQQTWPTIPLGPGGGGYTTPPPQMPGQPPPHGHPPMGAWGPPPPPSDILPPPPPTFTGPMQPGPQANFAPTLSATPMHHQSPPPRPMSPGHFHPHSHRPPTPPTPHHMPPPPPPIIVPGPGMPPGPHPPLGGCAPGCQPGPPPPPPCPCQPLPPPHMVTPDVLRHSPQRSHRSHRSSPSPRGSDGTLPHIIGPEDELQALKIQHMELANATRETRLIIERKEAEINMEKEAQRIAEKERLVQHQSNIREQEVARFAEKERLHKERFLLEQRLKELTEQERMLSSPQTHVPRRSPPSPRLGPPTPPRHPMSMQQPPPQRYSPVRNQLCEASVFANAQLHQLAMENAQLEKDNEQERRRLDQLAATLVEQERRLDELDRELHTPPRPASGQSPQYQQTTTTVETYRYGNNNNNGQTTTTTKGITNNKTPPRHRDDEESDTQDSGDSRGSPSPGFSPLARVASAATAFKRGKHKNSQHESHMDSQFPGSPSLGFSPAARVATASAAFKRNSKSRYEEDSQDSSGSAGFSPTGTFKRNSRKSHYEEEDYEGSPSLGFSPVGRVATAAAAFKRNVRSRENEQHYEEDEFGFSPIGRVAMAGAAFKRGSRGDVERESGGTPREFLSPPERSPLADPTFWV